MNAQSTYSITSFSLSGASVVLATISITLGQFVYYLDYLPLFNAMAFGMLLLGVSGVIAGLVGVFAAKEIGTLPWLATVTGVFVVGFYLFAG